MSTKEYTFLNELPLKLSDLEIDLEIEDNPNMTKITLSADQWIDNQQTVEVQGIVADETAQIVYIHTVYNPTMIEAAADAEINAIVQGENSITFSCVTPPAIDIDYFVEWEEIDYIQPMGAIGFFYIQNEMFTFGIGMTLVDWCSSAYNTKGYWINEYGFWSADQVYVNFDLNSNNDFTITSGRSLTLSLYNGNPVPILMSFYIEGTYYFAETGMSWRVWCESKYNTTAYYEPMSGTSDYIWEVAEDLNSEEYIRSTSEGYTLLNSPGIRMDPDTVIESITYSVDTTTSLPTIGVFIINDIHYNYEEGMTLSLWCNSDYNTNNFLINDTGFWTTDGILWNPDYNINNNILITSTTNIPLTPHITIMTFTVNGSTYQVENGFTWHDAITTLNSQGLNVTQISGNYVTNSSGQNLLYSTNRNVSWSDTIISDVYKWDTTASEPV